MQGYTDKINTQKAANTRAAKAEETILSLLLNNPEFYEKVKTHLKPETFLTDFNRRIFITISQRLEEGRGTDLTLLAGEFNEEEMSRLSALVANGSNLANSISECEDCIRVLLEEGEKRERRNTDVTEMSDEEFLDLFRKKNID
jgi:DNA primase